MAGCILDVCWTRCCNVVYIAIGMAICIIEFSLASVYHTAMAAVVISIAVFIASLIMIFVTNRAKQRVAETGDYPFIFKCIWLSYVVTTLILAFAAFERASSLVSGQEWREDLDGEFPFACSGRS